MVCRIYGHAITTVILTNIYHISSEMSYFSLFYGVFEILKDHELSKLKFYIDFFFFFNSLFPISPILDPYDHYAVCWFPLMLHFLMGMTAAVYPFNVVMSFC